MAYFKRKPPNNIIQQPTHALVLGRRSLIFDPYHPLLGCRALMKQNRAETALLVAFDVDLKVPFRLAEKRRLSRRFRDVLSEGVARVSHPAGSIEHRREPEGQVCGRFFFGS